MTFVNILILYFHSWVISVYVADILNKFINEYFQFIILFKHLNNRLMFNRILFLIMIHSLGGGGVNDGQYQRP